MDFGIFLILAILIICVTISLNTYMDFVTSPRLKCLQIQDTKNVLKI